MTISGEYLSLSGLSLTKNLSFGNIPNTAHLFPFDSLLDDHATLVVCVSGPRFSLQGARLLRDLLLEQVENPLWHLVLVLGFLLFELAVLVVVQDAGKNALADFVDIILRLLSPDIHRDLESVLDTASLMQEHVKVRHA